jgi:hypothetical protein
VRDSIAFAMFVAIFGGGLAVLAAGMAWIVAALIRRNRRQR